MIGVPLAIVDKQKVLKLVEKLFKSEDTGAEFELELDASAGGGFIVKMKIKSRVSTTFASALLAGRDIGLYDPTFKLAQSAPAPNVTPPPETSSKKK